MVVPPVTYQVGAVWYPGKIWVSNFQARFIVKLDQLPASGLVADGCTVTVHRDPRGFGAIGLGGAALGYGNDAIQTQGQGIVNSFALRMDTWDGTTSHSTFGFLQGGLNGGSAANAAEHDMTGYVNFRVDCIGVLHITICRT